MNRVGVNKAVVTGKNEFAGIVISHSSIINSNGFLPVRAGEFLLENPYECMQGKRAIILFLFFPFFWKEFFRNITSFLSTMVYIKIGLFFLIFNCADIF